MEVNDCQIIMMDKNKNLSSQLYSLASHNFPNQSSWTQSQFSDILKLKHVFVIGVLVKEQLVGFLCGSITMFEAEIYNFCVSKDNRRKGFGKKMLEQMTKLMDKYDVKDLFLEVRASNKGAIKLYESFGFKTLSIRKDYYSNPKEDAYLLGYKACEKRGEAKKHENISY